jgi:nickel transport protein
MSRYTGNVAVIILALVLCAQVAVAHKVNLFGYAEGGFVYVEGYFTDGAPSMDSEVEVYGSKGALVAQGVTDGDGRFFFPAETPGSYRVALKASMGHVTEIVVEVGEKKREREVAAGGSSGVGNIGQVSPVSPVSPVSAPELYALEDKVARLTKEVRALRKQVEKPGFSQIVGGLGFIIGMAGAYLWGASKMKG